MDKSAFTRGLTQLAVLHTRNAQFAVQNGNMDLAYSELQEIASLSQRLRYHLGIMTGNADERIE